MRNTNRQEMKLLLSLRSFILGNQDECIEWERLRPSKKFKEMEAHKNYEPFSAWYIISRWLERNHKPQKKRYKTDNTVSLFSLLLEYSGDTFYEELYGRFVQIADEKDVLEVFKKLGDPPIRTALSGRIKEKYYMDEDYRLKFRELIKLATITPEEEIEDNPPTPPPSDSDDRLKRKMRKRR